MSYTPKQWQCGDTISAEELNRMEQGIVEAGQGGGDCGYECTESETTIFDGSLTTVSMGEFSGAPFDSSQPIEGNSISVTFDGVDYELPKTVVDSDIYYGEVDSNGPIFTTYPCVIVVGPDYNYLIVASNGTYQLSVTLVEKSVATTECFKSAVKSASTFLLKAVSEDEIIIDSATYIRVTYDHTWQEVHDALREGMFVCILNEASPVETTLFRVMSTVIEAQIISGYPFMLYVDSENLHTYVAQTSDGYVCELINGQA